MKKFSYLLIALMANHEPEMGHSSNTEEMLIMEKSEDALDGKGENKYRSDLNGNKIQKQEDSVLKPVPHMSKKRSRHN